MYILVISVNSELCLLLTGRKSGEEVKTGVRHIVADIVAKDIDTRDELKKRCVVYGAVFRYLYVSPCNNLSYQLWALLLETP